MPSWACQFRWGLITCVIACVGAGVVVVCMPSGLGLSVAAGLGDVVILSLCVMLDAIRRRQQMH